MRMKKHVKKPIRTREEILSAVKNKMKRRMKERMGGGGADVLKKLEMDPQNK